MDLAVTCDGLVKRYGDLTELDHLSLSVPQRVQILPAGLGPAARALALGQTRSHLWMSLSFNLL